MKNIFRKFFKKETEQLEKETDKVISACISLMIEVSMADQSIDDEEIESLKRTLSEKFNVEGSEIENLINEGKETQKEYALPNLKMQKCLSLSISLSIFSLFSSRTPPLPHKVSLKQVEKRFRFVVSKLLYNLLE